MFGAFRIAEITQRCGLFLGSALLPHHILPPRHVWDTGLGRRPSPSSQPWSTLEGGTCSLSCPPASKTWPGRRPCLGSSAQEPSARPLTCDLQARRSIPVSEQLSCTKMHANGSGESGLLEILPEIWGRQGLAPHWSAEGPRSGCVGC